MTTIDLFTGFLGAGKTTFIKEYTKWLAETGFSFCVIENEYGAAGVDGTDLENSNIKVLELSGGCICCSLKVGFHDAILQLAETFDRIIVEPSGIFSPADFFDVVYSPKVSEKCEMGLAAIVCDVHMTNLDGRALEVFRQELNVAGIIIVSKTQNATPDELATCMEFISENITHDLDVPILTDDWKDYTPKEFEIISRAKPAYYDKSLTGQDHSTLFSGASLRPKREYDEKELRHILLNSRENCGGEILRMKGFLNSNCGKSFHVNCTARDIEIKKLPKKLPSMINIIGRGFDRKKLKNLIEE